MFYTIPICILSKYETNRFETSKNCSLFFSSGFHPTFLDSLPHCPNSCCWAANNRQGQQILAYFQKGSVFHITNRIHTTPLSARVPIPSPQSSAELSSCGCHPELFAMYVTSGYRQLPSAEFHLDTMVLMVLQLISPQKMRQGHLGGSIAPSSSHYQHSYLSIT